MCVCVRVCDADQNAVVRYTVLNMIAVCLSRQSGERLGSGVKPKDPRRHVKCDIAGYPWDLLNMGVKCSLRRSECACAYVRAHVCCVLQS